MMKLTVFGNNATCPQAGGACSCFLLETGTKKILLDMGCSSLPWLRKVVDLAQLDLIVLSHLHFDHCGDLFCAKYHLETRAANGEKLPQIPLICPKLPQWAENELLSGEVFHHITAEDGLVYPLEDGCIHLVRVEHLVESYAVQVCAEGKKFVYSGDSGFCPALEKAAKGADCFLCEATFPSGSSSEEGHHLSALSAGKIAAKAGAMQLLLTHYHGEQAEAIKECAQTSFPGAVLTMIGKSYMV